MRSRSVACLKSLNETGLTLWGAVMGTLRIGWMSTPSASSPLRPVSGANPRQHAVLVRQGVNIIPELLDQSLDQTDAVAEPGKAVLTHEGLDQPRGNFQILGFFGNDFRSELKNGPPIRAFRIAAARIAAANRFPLGRTCCVPRQFDGLIN